MAEHRADGLEIFGVQPEIQRLFNDRYRLTFRCELGDNVDDWYYANRDNIFADFDTLSDAGYGDAPATPDPDSTWPNQRLVRHGLNYIPQKEVPVLEFIYETLTSTWTKEVEDVPGSTESGLRTLERVQVARIDTAAPYDEDDIGVATIVENGKTLVLAGFEDRSKSDAETQIGRFITRWAEAGTVNRREDKVGSQQAITIQAIGEVPSTPSGYTLASTNVGNFEGFKTNDYTFLKSDVEISRSTDFVGSQQAIVIEQFDGTPSAPSGYSLAKTEVSEVEGIPTQRFTYLKDNTVLSNSFDYVGSQQAEVIQVFNPSSEPASTNGGTLAQKQSSDVDGIETTQYTFLKPSILSRNTQIQNQGALQVEVVECFNEVPVSTIEGILVGEQESDIEGIPTKRFTFVKGEGQISSSTRPGRVPGTTEVTVVSNGTKVIPPGEVIAETETNQDGYVQYRVTSVQGTITGVKMQYKDVIDVPTPGTVNLKTVNKSAGGISGTIAVADVKSPDKEPIAATVTLEITTSPPDTVDLAFDLSNVSCSVTSIQMSENFRGTDFFETASGNTRFYGQRKTAGMSARLSNYPRHYLLSTSESGSFSYTSSYDNQSNSPNTLLPIGQTSTTNTFLDGSGSTTAEGYVTTGVIQRKSRPVLSLLNGTIYYEVITWTV